MLIHRFVVLWVASHLGCGDGPTIPSDGGVDSGTTSDAGSDSGTTCPGVDLGNDPDHCGECNWSCGGGSCADGRCAPVELVGDQYFADGIAIAGADVFYRSGHRVFRTTPEGGEPVAVVDAGDPFQGVTATAMDERDLYWFVNDRDLFRADRDGRDVTPLHSLDGLALVAEAVVSEGDLLFAATGWNEDLDPGGQVVRVPRDEAPITLASGQWGTFSLSVLGDDIFFANTGILDQSIPGSIARVHRDGTGEEHLVTDRYPAAVAVSEAGIFWTEPFHDRIMRSRLDGSGVEMVADGQAMPQPIVLHRGWVVWANIDERAVFAASLDGGAPERLAEDVFTTRLASDGHFVYWASRGHPESSFADGWIGRVALR